MARKAKKAKKAGKAKKAKKKAARKGKPVSKKQVKKAKKAGKAKKARKAGSAKKAGKAKKKPAAKRAKKPFLRPPRAAAATEPAVAEVALLEVEEAAGEKIAKEPVRVVDPEERIAWWREARFGMFIHWGVYAVPAGTWKGERIPGIGEWIMNRARIPREEYALLAEKFNPVKFDADEWVRIAKSAGQKYIVITSKHHDGFALFDSAASDYNIVGRTPFGRDPIAELAEACAKEGIRLCFYYSQSQDWYEPDAMGNSWDFPDEEAKDFAKYLREKVKPQLRELLTNYGPIGLIWFDTPQRITCDESVELRDYVHELQPECIVSGRVGHGLGDYSSMGDNMIPAGPVEGYWETPATMNDTWGFKSYDQKWKSVKTLLTLLVDLASKGVNYLLNVGPTARGVIPQESVERLAAIGRWLDVNGEAIYGTSASPFPYEFDWGRITRNPGRLHLLFTEWPRDVFTLYGLRSEVTNAYLLADPSREAGVAQTHDREADHHVLELALPAEAPDENVSVVVLELAGEADVDVSPIQQPDGAVSLPVHLAEIHGPGAAFQANEMRVARHGAMEKWRSEGDWLKWRFKVSAPGEFEVRVHTIHRREWLGGHDVKVSVAGAELTGTIAPDEKIETARGQYFPEFASRLGRVTVAEAGRYDLELRAVKIDPEVKAGFSVSSVSLVPVG